MSCLEGDLANTYFIPNIFLDICKKYPYKKNKVKLNPKILSIIPLKSGKFLIKLSIIRSLLKINLYYKHF